MSYRDADLIRVISGVGEVVAGHLERLGLQTIGDLLTWYPRQYVDGSQPLKIARLPLNALCAIAIRVQSVELKRTKQRGLSMLEVLGADDSGEISLRFFNQTFLKNKLTVGSQWICIGKAQRFQGQTVMLSPLLEAEPRILALYALTKGLTSRMLRGFMDFALKNLELEDTLPKEIVQQAQLLSRKEAMQAIHQPTSMLEVEKAKRRLAFEEVFWFFVHMAQVKRDAKQEVGIPLSLDLAFLQAQVKALPFALTAGQKRAVWDSLQEMHSGIPMTRLLNGDVGAGKTVVAALIAAVVAQAGWQTVLLVPTEILAKQHYQSLAVLLKNSGKKVAMWTAAQKDDLAEADIVVGTHAVLQESFILPRLGFIIVDEQHRFGVAQRQMLRQKQEKLPHMLSMTATPIPRTLALTLYGDLSVSLLLEKPKDRLEIETVIIQPDSRHLLHSRLLSELQAGHQAFVICPLIEEKKKADEEGELSLFEVLSGDEQQKREQKTVLVEVERLRREHPEYGVIEAVHGKMKAQEKRAIMERMAAGEIQLLVATSVIEVGVDVPNATVMVIEGAEHFGLAQLHQFRGRIGRGKAQSYCFLCPDLWGETIQRRLEVLTATTSGFVIAEQDLALRGPGELIGKVQSGLPDFRMASLTDTLFLQQVKEICEHYIQKNPNFLQTYSHEGYFDSGGNLE